MKRVFESRSFILAFILVIAISAFSFVVYNGAANICQAAQDCTQRPKTSGNGEMIWEVLPRQFVSAILFR